MLEMFLDALMVYRSNFYAIGISWLALVQRVVRLWLFMDMSIDNDPSVESTVPVCNGRSKAADLITDHRASRLSATYIFTETIGLFGDY